MATVKCIPQVAIEGDTLVVRFPNFKAATAEPPKLNTKGEPQKSGMVAQTYGFQAVDGEHKLSAFLMRRVSK